MQSLTVILEKKDSVFPHLLVLFDRKIIPSFGLKTGQEPHVNLTPKECPSRFSMEVEGASPLHAIALCTVV